jgi:hypothetical protein
VSGVGHALTLVAIGAAAGAAIVNAFYLLRLVLDLIAARDVGQPHIWPDELSLTVWTGLDWFTVTVMPVAFGRWGVAVCRDDAPRRAEPLELVCRARSEPEARGRALLAVHGVLSADPETATGVARVG